MLVVLLTMGFFLPLAAQDEIKIGYMNPQAVLDALPQTAELRAQMETFIQQKQQQLAEKEQSVNAEYSAFLQNAINLSDEELAAEQERLQVLRDELDQMQQNAEVEVQRKRSEMLSPILQRMDEAVAQIAESMGLDFVLNENTRGGDTILFYGQPTLNITQKVIDAVTNS